jgi:hypothetical protein
MTPKDKLTNPKDAIGSSKVPLHLVPETMRAYAAVAFLEGALKYGTANWRVAGVRTSIYYSALQRHLSKWWNGEEADPDTGVPHLASALACIGIIVDAREVGKLTDDRPPRADVGALLARLEAGPTAGLLALYGDRNPTHYTIEDSSQESPRQSPEKCSSYSGGCIPGLIHTWRCGGCLRDLRVGAK